MGANRLPYFYYMPQFQQGELLECWLVSSTILATTTFQNLLMQLHMAEYLLKYFALHIAIWQAFVGAIYSTLSRKHMRSNWHVLLLVPTQGNLLITANNNDWYFALISPFISPIRNL